MLFGKKKVKDKFVESLEGFRTSQRKVRKRKVYAKSIPLKFPKGRDATYVMLSNGDSNAGVGSIGNFLPKKRR